MGNNPITRTDPDGRDWYENKEGHRVWYEGSGEREGYTRSTKDFTVSAGGNTSYNYSPTQQDPVSKTETLLSGKDDHVRQGTDTGCYSACLKQSGKTGFKPADEGKNGHTVGIQIGKEVDTESGGYMVFAHSDAQEGLAYMDKLIDMGISPVVGVDHSRLISVDDGGIQNDGISDHYVSISSRTTNLSTGAKTYGFFDPGSSSGSDPRFKFTMGANGLYQSRNTYFQASENKTYTLSFVVKHKTK